MNFRIEKSEKIIQTQEIIKDYLKEFRYLRHLFIIFKQIVFLGKVLNEREGGVGELGLFFMVVVFLQISQDPVENINQNKISNDQSETSIENNKLNPNYGSSINSLSKIINRFIREQHNDFFKRKYF